MTQNCVWLWGSGFGYLGSIEHPFITIIARLWVVVSVWVQFMSQIDLFKNYSYSIEQLRPEEVVFVKVPSIGQIDFFQLFVFDRTVMTQSGNTC